MGSNKSTISLVSETDTFRPSCARLKPAPVSVITPFSKLADDIVVWGAVISISIGEFVDNFCAAVKLVTSSTELP